MNFDLPTGDRRPTIQIRIERSIQERLKQIAQRQNVSVNVLCAAVLTQFSHQYVGPPAPEQAPGHTETTSLLTEREWTEQCRAKQAKTPGLKINFKRPDKFAPEPAWDALTKQGE